MIQTILTLLTKGINNLRNTNYKTWVKIIIIAMVVFYFLNQWMCPKKPAPGKTLVKTEVKTVTKVDTFRMPAETVFVYLNVPKYIYKTKYTLSHDTIYIGQEDMPQILDDALDDYFSIKIYDTTLIGNTFKLNIIDTITKNAFSGRSIKVFDTSTLVKSNTVTTVTKTKYPWQVFVGPSLLYQKQSPLAGFGVDLALKTRNKLFTIGAIRTSNDFYARGSIMFKLGRKN